jgi:hypothetical protein
MDGLPRSAEGEGVGVRIEIMDGQLMARPIGAAVVRPNHNGVVVELGPADGPPLTRIFLSKDEASQVRKALHAVLNGRNEEIILVDE